jgi:acetyl-CoA carboxylase biotin carboxyl carrier protein
MNVHEQEMAWLKRVEDLIHALEGSTIGELELTEAGTEIIIRRQPGLVMTSIPTPQLGVPSLPATTGRMIRADNTVAVVAPLTGVYYAAPSPTSPPFVAVGDMVEAGQVVAQVEAMKVFNDIQAEVAGRVTALVASNGNVVQKGDVLMRIEPA